MNDPILRWAVNILMIVGVILVAIIPFAIYKSVQTENQMMEECRADGYKGYQCVGIIKGRTR